MPTTEPTARISELVKNVQNETPPMPSMAFWKLASVASVGMRLTLPTISLLGLNDDISIQTAG